MIGYFCLTKNWSKSPDPKWLFSPDANNGNYEIVKERDRNVKELIRVQYISNSLDYVYPKEMFYNSDWHLNEIGRKCWSEQLIKDIKGATDKKQPVVDKNIFH